MELNVGWDIIYRWKSVMKFNNRVSYGGKALLHTLQEAEAPPPPFIYTLGPMGGAWRGSKFSTWWKASNWCYLSKGSMQFGVKLC